LSQTVFVLEDDTDILRLVQFHLEAAGFVVRPYMAMGQIVAEAEREPPALFLLDIMVPGGDGLDLCRRLRKNSALSTVPIIFLTARAAENDRVMGLELGADDYITKPFGSSELLARIRVALRHAADLSAPAPMVVEVGSLRMDFASREVTLEQKPVRLTKNEFDLLAVLIRHAGQVITNGQLLQEVWGDSAKAHATYVRVYMRSLRKKLEADPTRPRLLLTELGIGYRLKPD